MTIRAIVTDIEGTTTPVAFVTETLFPYATEHLAEFVKIHADVPAVATEIEAVRRELVEPATRLEDVIAQLLAWSKMDAKKTPLKAIQGMIWRDGYERGDFLGAVYPDAVTVLRRWHASGIRLYVYSSGSVEAQRLLFRYSDAGDLSKLFADHFDTRIGAKRDPAAYTRIVEAIGLPASDILFLSDVTAELDAARSAGLSTTHVVRDHQATTDHPIATTFESIDA